LFLEAKDNPVAKFFMW